MKKKIPLLFLTLVSIVFAGTVNRAFADAAGELEQADTYYKNKDYSQAEAIYQSVKTHYPLTEEAFKAYRKLIVLYIVTNNDPQAEAVFQELVSTYPDNRHAARAVHDTGTACRDLKKYEKAKQYYQYVVDHFSGNEYIIWAIWAQKDLIKTELYLVNDTAAEAGISKLRSDFSSHKDLPNALCKVADCYRKLKRYDKAIELYQNVLDTYPDDESAIHCQKGLVYSNIWCREDVNDPNVQTAINKLTADFNDHPDFAHAILRIGEEYYNKAMELDEQDLGDKSIDHFSKVIEVWQPILTRKPVTLVTVRAHFLTGQCYIQLGDFTKAIEHCELIVNKWSKNESKYVIDYVIRARKYLAILNIDIGDDPNALAQVERLITDFNDSPALPRIVFHIGEEYYFIAENYKKARQLDKAKPLYQKALDVWEFVINKEDLKPFRSGQLYTFAAFCYERLGEYIKAADYFQEVVDNYPEYKYITTAQSMVAQCYEKLKRSPDVAMSADEADLRIEAAYLAVIENWPEKPAAVSAMNKLGLLYFSKEQWPEAIVYFEMYRERQPGHYRFLHMLGQAYENTGDNELAIQVYEQYLAMAGEGDHFRDEVQQRLNELKGGQQ